MGKEWLYWVGSGNASGGSSRSSKRGRSDKNSSSPSGCMSAVFQLFDNLHQFHFALPNHPSSLVPSHSLPLQLPEEEPNNTVLKGVEAPRNSLESEAPLMEVAPASSSTIKQHHNLNLPMGIQIKTSTPNSKPRSTDDLSSECSSSPGTKTPNLVARLMGLDLLPELSSPRQSASSNYSSTPNPPSKSKSSPSSSHHCRSLPETPRISLARRSDADNYHHRYSLQVNKENIFTSEEFELSSYLNAKLARRRESGRNEEDIKSSSSLYAKQIVKQVKENISRRVGADITNTTARTKEHRRDEHLVLLKSKKPALTRMGAGQDDQSTLSCSPRLRFMEVKTKPTSPSSSLATKSQNSVSPKFQVAAPLEKESEPQQQVDKAAKIKFKKITSERYDFRSKRSTQTSDAIRNKQEEPFIRSSSTSKVKHSDKKCRKTPLSNNLVNINVPKFLSLKKDPSPNSTPTLSKNQVSLESSTQLSRSQSRSYISKSQHNNCISADNNSNGVIPTTTSSTTVEYISRLLGHIGIDKNTPITIKQWYSPSHPLHPSIYQRLQLSTTSTTASTSPRLIFDVVNELLVDILKPYLNLRPWVSNPSTHNTQMCGGDLINKLSKRIGSFPGADCRVLEDIDALIDGDLCRSTQEQRSVAFEEEGEGIVAEIERDIVDTLVHETAMLMWQEGRTIR